MLHVPARFLIGATCTNNDEPFESAEIVNAGEDAVTFNCPDGHVGNMTRRCMWTSPTSQRGVWASVVDNCKRTPHTTCDAYGKGPQGHPN